MDSISIILRRPPYGTIDAPEAIRHALGGVVEEMSVRLILVDGGVHAARKEQDVSNTAYLNMEAGIRDCIDMGVEVYLDKAALEAERLGREDFIDGVMIATGPELAKVIAGTNTTMIF